MDRDFLAGQALAQRAFTDRLRLRGGQLLVQRVGVLTGHADLGEHREADIVGELAELLDLGIAARFLAEEVVGGEAQHFQACACFSAYSACRPSYCGVRPHLEATFTTSSTRPR
ncbi:hypothetical protein G6F32_015559 [Rhizopus arrhizus]|nr:hypothetical protein G6F32_015559 [Rhizopus arrhizus]